MPRHIWSVLCRSVSTDKDSNNVSLLEVTEQLGGSVMGEVKPDAIPFQLSFVTLWSRSDPDQGEKAAARLRLLGPNGGDAAPSIQQEVDLTHFRRLRTKVLLASLPYRGPGQYEFSVELEEDTTWVEVARIPLEINVEYQHGVVTPPTQPSDQP